MRWPSHIVCIEKTRIHINFGWNTMGEEGGLDTKMVIKLLIQT